MNPIKDVNLSSVETNLKLILSKLPVPNSDIVAEIMKGWLENLVQITTSECESKSENENDSESESESEGDSESESERQGENGSDIEHENESENWIVKDVAHIIPRIPSW